MMRKVLLQFLSTVPLLSLAPQHTCAQPTSMGTEFWLAFMENLDLGMNGIPYMYVVVSSPVNTQGELQVPATGDAFPFTVQAGHASIVFVPSNYLYPVGAEAYYEEGLRIVADDPVDVFAYHHRMYFSDATLVLPVEQLGAEYLVTTQLDMTAQFPCEFVVQATMDDTEVEITPSVITSSLRPAGVPFLITLQAGEVFQLQAFEDLTGSRVRSLDPEKPVAVFGGSKVSRLGCMEATDHMYTQLMPMTAAGLSHTVVPYKNRGGDIFRITALQDGTIVTISNGASVTLDAAEFHDQLITIPARITSNQPVTVVQFNQSQSCNGAVGDGCMAFVPPSDHTRRRVVFNSITGPGGPADGWTPNHTLNIWTSSPLGVGNITLDGVDISGSFDPMTNVPDHWYAQLDIAAGEHILQSNAQFQAQASGFGSYNSYTFFTGFDPDDIHSGVPDGQGLPHAYTAVVHDELPAALLGVDGPMVFVLFDGLGRKVAERKVQGPDIIDLRPITTGMYQFALLDLHRQRVRNGRLFITR